MNPFAISGLLTGVSSFGFGLLVLLNSANKRLGQVWFLFCISVALWGFGSMAIALAHTPERALLTWRIAFAVGVVWIPTLFYHFVCLFCETGSKRSIITHYVIGFLFFLTMPFPYFYSGVRFVFGSIYYTTPGPIFPFFTFWWVAYVVFSHYKLIEAYRHSEPNKKNQIRFFFLATAVGYGFGSLDYLPIFHIDMYPWGNFGIILYPFIMSYAILRHRLMDITLIIRKTVVYSVVTGALTAIFVLTVGMFAFIYGGVAMPKMWSSAALAALLVAVIGEPLRKRLQSIIDNRFFHQYVDREQKLYELSREVIIHPNPEAMANALIRILTDAIQPKDAGLYLRSNQGVFHRVSIQADSILPEIIPDGDPLIQYLGSHPQPFLRQAVAEASTDTRNGQRNPFALWDSFVNLFSPSLNGNPHLRKAASAQIPRLGIVAAFPLVSQGDLLGLLLLGEKKSEEIYSEEDIRLLRIVSNQAALAYQRVKFLEMMVNSARTDTLGKISGGFAHEMRTPLANISLPAEMTIMDINDAIKGTVKLEDVGPEIVERMRGIMNQAKKASEKIEAIRNFSKPGEAQPEEVHIIKVLNSGIALLSDLITTSRCTIDIKMEDGLSPVQGNPKQLEIVFVNLIKNAAEAMTDSTQRVITVRGYSDVTSIAVEIGDSGPGIKKTDMGHVFDAYWTTKGSVGTGIGLFLSQQVIKAHGGSIEVKSEEGQGTTFVIRLPKMAPKTPVPLGIVL